MTSNVTKSISHTMDLVKGCSGVLRSVQHLTLPPLSEWTPSPVRVQSESSPRWPKMNSDSEFSPSPVQAERKNSESKLNSECTRTPSSIQAQSELRAKKSESKLILGKSHIFTEHIKWVSSDVCTCILLIIIGSEPPCFFSSLLT